MNYTSCSYCNISYEHTKENFVYFRSRNYLSKKCKRCNYNLTKQYWATRKERKQELDKKVRENRKAKGSCKNCHRPKMSSGRCELHWFASIGANAGLPETLNMGRLLKDKLHSQNYSCPYTKEELIPGKNASLDHIKPKSRFPELSTNLSNLEWVTILVNRSKSDMTKEEYYSFIEKVLMIKEIGTHITPITID